MKILNNTHSLRGAVTNSSSSWIATINPFAFYLQAAFSSPKHQSHGNLFSSVVFCQEPRQWLVENPSKMYHRYMDTLYNFQKLVRQDFPLQALVSPVKPTTCVWKW